MLNMTYDLSLSSFFPPTCKGTYSASFFSNSMWTEIEGDYKGILMALFFVCFDLPQLSNS